MVYFFVSLTIYFLFFGTRSNRFLSVYFSPLRQALTKLGRLDMLDGAADISKLQVSPDS